MFEKEGFSNWFKSNTPKEGLSEYTTFSKQFVVDAWNDGYANGCNKAKEAKEKLNEAEELLNMVLRLHYKPDIEECTLNHKVAQFLKEIDK